MCILQDSVYFSYWVPFSYSRHRDLIARLQMNEKTRLEVLGQSLDGRDIDLLIVGELQASALSKDSQHFCRPEKVWQKMKEKLQFQSLGFKLG